MPHYTLLRQSQWIDLPALLAVEQDSPLYNVKSQAPLFYAESWALVHMLYLGDDYRPKLRGLLEGIKAGASMADTFQKAYGKSVEQAETGLLSYMSAKRFNAWLFDTRLAAASEPETAEAGPLEIGLVLAEIVANGPRRRVHSKSAWCWRRSWRMRRTKPPRGGNCTTGWRATTPGIGGSGEGWPGRSGWNRRTA